MKQLVLKVNVFDKDGKCLFNRDVNSIQSVQSCIDLFHGSGVKIELIFEEIDVQSPVPVNN